MLSWEDALHQWKQNWPPCSLVACPDAYQRQLIKKDAARVFLSLFPQAEVEYWSMDSPAGFSDWQALITQRMQNNSAARRLYIAYPVDSLRIVPPELVAFLERPKKNRFFLGIGNALDPVKIKGLSELRDKVSWVEVRRVEKKDFGKWRRFFENHYQVTIDIALWHSLTEGAGYDLSILATALENRILFDPQKKTITRAEMEQIGGLLWPLSVFRFVDHLVEKEEQSCLRTYGTFDRSLDQRLSVVNMTLRVIRQLLQLGTFSNASDATLASHLHLPPFAIPKLKKQRQLYSHAMLVRLLELLLRADRNVKIRAMGLFPTLIQPWFSTLTFT